MKTLLVFLGIFTYFFIAYKKEEIRDKHNFQKLLLKCKLMQNDLARYHEVHKHDDLV